MPTSRFTDFTEGQFEIFIFQFLVSIFDTIYLYSFKFKVLRFLFQLESPNSEHRNSSYVRNNPDYFMFKTNTGIGLHITHFESVPPTSHPKCPKMCVFSHFSIHLIPNQFYTSNTHQNNSKFTLESLFYSIPLSITYFSSKFFHDFLQRSFQHGL